MRKSIILLLIAFILGACAAWQAPAPDRSSKTIDLLVNASVMPPGWTMFDRHVLAKDAHHLSVGDSASVAFEIKGITRGKARQEVHRYRNSAVAKSVYDDMIHMVGDVPAAWNYHSTVADESSFACYDYEGREPYPVCEWAAYYEEYVVTFRAWLTPDHMSLSDLEKVIRAIDLQMAQQLGKE